MTNDLVDGKSFIDDLLNTQPAPAVRPATVNTNIRFTIQTFILRLLLEKAYTVVPARDSAMAVLKNFQIRVAPSMLRIIASDSELSMIATTEIVDVQSGGIAVFPAKKMMDIVRESTNSEVHIQVTGKAASIAIGRTTWNLSLEGGEDFPRMPEITEATFASVDRIGFASALHTVRYAACRDPNRSSLMMIDVQRGRMLGCDGARLHQATTVDFPFDFQIPIGAVDDLLKLLRSTDLTDIQVGDIGQQLIFRFGDDVLIVNKLLTRFPDMEAQLLRPALANRHELAVERDDLVKAIKRVRINADDKTSAIALILDNNTMTVSAKDKFYNDATETIDATWAGTPRTLVVNHVFLTDLINRNTAATLHFNLGDDTKTRKSPILLRDTDAGTVGVIQQMVGDWLGT